MGDCIHVFTSCLQHGHSHGQLDDGRDADRHVNVVQTNFPKQAAQDANSANDIQCEERREANLADEKNRIPNGTALTQRGRGSSGLDMMRFPPWNCARAQDAYTDGQRSFHATTCSVLAKN